ncbi:MAG TPA: hypothetical protein VEK36_00975 [Candidatus Paceibacterota bacterium]|nr:hypothetical protein [Candidatus Paceibacterota bacterium]
MQLQYFNTQAFSNIGTTLQHAPAGFRYGFINNIFKESEYENLISTFPDVRRFKLVDKMSGGGRKRFYTGPVYNANTHLGCICHFHYLSSLWKNVLGEAFSDEFKLRLSQFAGMPFNSVSVFGFTYGNEGCVQEPHVDGAVREYDEGPIKSVLTAIIYMNRSPEGSSGTCMYAPDRSTVLFQAPRLRNGLFFFEQHPQAWHGFPIMPQDTERHILALAYSNEKIPIKLKKSWAHRLYCKNFWRSVIRQQ